MRIRIYFPHLPDPSLGGGELLVFEQMHALAGLGHNLHLCTWSERPAPLDAVPSAADEMPKDLTNEKSPGPQWPPYIHEDISQRVLTRSRVVRVVEAALRGRSSTELAHYPEIKSHCTLRDLPACDLAIYSYSFAHSWLRKPHLLPEEARRVVYLQNIESTLALHRVSQARGNLIKRALLRLNATRLQKSEANLSSLVNELWFVSPEDLKSWALQYSNPPESVPPNLSPQVPCGSRWVGPTFEQSLRRTSLEAFEKRIRGHSQGRPPYLVGFLGNLGFRPNAVGAEWLVTEIAPRLEQRGFKGKILIAGRNASARLRRLSAAQSCVKFLGEIPAHSDSFFDDLSFMAVPHLEGSGVRMKALEGIVRGIPILTHPAGTCGMSPSLITEPEVQVLETADQWAEFLSSRPSWVDRARILEKCPARELPPALDPKRVYAFLEKDPALSKDRTQ